MKRLTTGLTPRRLRFALALFFIALTLPSAALVYQAYSRLKWETFHQHQQMAEEFTQRVRETVATLIVREEAHGFSDYAFLVIEGDANNPFVQRSPLADYPVGNNIPGLVGYFQVDAAGAFSTPLLPAAETDATAYGVSAQALTQRQKQAETIRAILSENRLVHPEQPRVASDTLMEEKAHFRDKEASLAPTNVAEPAPSYRPIDAKRAAPASQSVFDQLSQSAPAMEIPESAVGAAQASTDDMEMQSGFSQKKADKSFQTSHKSKPAKTMAKQIRRELGRLEGADASAPVTTGSIRKPLRIRTFESEIDPFEFSLLESGHFVLYRKVWREGQRYIQGALIDQQAFLNTELEQPFRTTALSRMSNLIIAYQGNILTRFQDTNAQRSDLGSSQPLNGSLLYRAPLNAPLGALELIFSVNQLPTGPGGTIVIWVTVTLGLVLLVGTLLLYRLGLGQIKLARQQQDFVSAVSHELKTPLTSIRMYSEILNEGWAGEEKQREYHTYINDESERLTRLINNVLQLARMTRNDQHMALTPHTIHELLNMLRSKITSQTGQAGFRLRINCPEVLETIQLTVDPDHFLQIFINLVDNAIKFSRDAEQKMIEITCAQTTDQAVQFHIRDWGPGIAGEHRKRIFELFYRSENELTRKTSGTGIGLALVYQLVRAMKGEIRVTNAQPGAQFSISFPAIQSDPAK